MAEGEGVVSINADLRKLIDQGADAEQAVDAVLRKARRSDLADLVRPLLVLRADNFVRANTRSREVEVDRRIAGGEDPISVRRKLANDGFHVGGHFILWLDATPAEHLARAAAQRSLANACIADAERHEAAAAEIEAAGASCLRDLVEGAA